MLGTTLIVGVLPGWNYSRLWPSGVVSVIIVVLIVLLLTGHLSRNTRTLQPPRSRFTIRPACSAACVPARGSDSR